jgi:hypothetical protein
MTAIELGDLEMAERFAPEVLQLEERYAGLSLGWFEALHRLLNACIPVAQGEPGGLGVLTEILQGWRSATQNLAYSYGLLVLSRGHAMAGDIDTGRRAASEALAWADAHDQHYLDAPLWLAEAELVERAGDRTRARTARKRALAIARQQGAGWSTWWCPPPCRNARGTPDDARWPRRIRGPSPAPRTHPQRAGHRSTGRRRAPSRQRATHEAPDVFVAGTVAVPEREETLRCNIDSLAPWRLACWLPVRSAWRWHRRRSTPIRSWLGMPG